MICPNCGAANDVGKKFCGECGTALEERKEPIPEGPIDWTEKLKNEPPVETPESVHKIVHKINFLLCKNFYHFFSHFYHLKMT